MPEYLVTETSQIPPGEGRCFIVGSTEIAIFHTRTAGFYATQASCPHRAGPLADGLTDGASVVCPLHERSFSLTTGEGIGNDYAIATFPVRISETKIYVSLTD
jgi:nitrite reductase (NADH) small subunit